MSWNRHASRNHQLTTGTARPRRHRQQRRTRSVRSVFAPVAGLMLAAGLLAGCGGGEEPEDTAAEQTQEASDSGGETIPEASDGGAGTGDGTGGAGQDGEDEIGDGPDDGSDDGTGGGSDGDAGNGSDGETGNGSDGGGDDGTDDGGTGENLFEGTWNFGHDDKSLSAEDLAGLIEAEALERGPDEMHLEVECRSGIDTVADDDKAECTAYGDEGAQHPWSVTGLPADAGLVIEVENVE